MRIVKGLRHAWLAENPWGKAPRPKGAKAAGLRFERSLIRSIPAAKHNQWLKFEDNGGVGYCCPDWLFVCRDTLFVVECKLTDWDEAGAQMRELYVPVLGLLWDGPIRCVTAAKNLSPATRTHKVVNTWDAALQTSDAVLHVWKNLVPPKARVEEPALRAYGSIFGDSSHAGEVASLAHEIALA